MGPYSPGPGLPTNLTVPCSCSFLSLQSGRGQREAGGAHSLAGLGRPSGVKEEMSSAPALKLQRIGATPPWRRAPPSLLGPVPGVDHSRAARLGLRLWPRPSTQGRGEGRKEREERREGEGGGGPGPRGVGRVHHAGIPPVPAPLPLRDPPFLLVSPTSVPQSSFLV